MAGGTAGQASHLRLNRRFLAFATLGIVAIGLYGPIAIPIFAHALKQHFSLSESRLGLLLSVGMTGSVVGGLVGGWIADRKGRLAAMRGLALTAAVGYVFCAFGSRLPLLVPGLIAGNFGYSGAFNAGAGLLSSLFPQRRRSSYSAVLVASAAAGIALPPVVTAVESAHLQGPLPFSVALGLPFLIVAAALILLVGALRRIQEEPSETDPEKEPEAGEKQASRATFAGVAIILLLATLHGTADTTLYSWMPKFLTDCFAEQAFPPGLVLSFYSAVYLAGRLCIALLPDSFAPRALLVFPGLLGGTFVLLSASAQTFAWAAGAYVAASAFYGLEFPALMGFAAQRFPTRFSTICGLVTATSLAAVGGVWGVGKWTEVAGSMRPGMATTASGFLAFSLLAAIWLAVARPRPKL